MHNWFKSWFLLSIPLFSFIETADAAISQILLQEDNLGLNIDDVCDDDTYIHINRTTDGMYLVECHHYLTHAVVYSAKTRGNQDLRNFYEETFAAQERIQEPGTSQDERSSTPLPTMWYGFPGFGSV